MTTKNILITGATDGIGKAAAIALAKQGHTVIIHGRNKQKAANVCEEIKATTGNKKIDTLIGELYLLKEVQQMANEFKQRYNHLDVLINNAGAMMGIDRETTSEGFEKTMAINLFAPFMLTELLLDPLKTSQDARIINVASNAHRFSAKPDFNDMHAEKKYNPIIAYGNAKLFLIWITQHMAAELKKQQLTNITVNSMHPGSIKTTFAVDTNLGPVLNFIGKLVRPFFKSPEKGADTIVYLASSNEVKNISGQYFVNRKPAKVANKYYSPANEQLVWDYCKQTLQLI